MPNLLFQFDPSTRFVRSMRLLGFAALVIWGLLPAVSLAQHPSAVTSIVNSATDTTLEVNHNGSLVASGTIVLDSDTPNDSIPVEGAGTRMMWYPAKAAFRAGSVGLTPGNENLWDADSIGRFSVAVGLEPKATQTSAVAMGHQTSATNVAATAMGQRTSASGNSATALGFGTRAEGEKTLAAGEKAIALHDNTFIWSDGSGTSAFTTGDDPNGTNVSGSHTFHVKVSGGARFITAGDNSVETYIAGGTAGWSNTSTRAAKTVVEPIDPATILSAVQEMPVSTWEYKEETGAGEGIRHIGPMAEDFHGELPIEVGGSNEHINSINADGVAFAAIQGLARKVDRQQETIDSLRHRVQQIETLENRLAQLEAQSNRSVLAGRPGSWLLGGALACLLLGGSLATLVPRPRG
mgnify:CR=1 FL=1